MHGSLPPIVIDGPDHELAFVNIPIDRRPDHAQRPCTRCRGHGAWNVLLHPDTMRCMIQGCDECDGCGWVSDPDRRTIDDIVYDEAGRPRWVLRLAPRTIPTRQP